MKTRSIEPRSWDRKKLVEHLHAFGGRRILVVGDVGVDRYTRGSVERISPEAPVPVVAVEEEWHKLGLAANVAENVRVLGGTALLTGIVGGDRNAEELRALLKRSDIADDCLVVDSSRRTVLKERIVTEQQQLLRVDYESLHAVDGSLEKKILAQVTEMLPSCDAIIVEDYAKGMISAGLAQGIFDLARSHGKPSLVDPNPRTDVEVYRGAMVLTPNTKEAESLTGMKIRDEASLLRVGEALLARTSARYVMITRGKEGMAIFDTEKGECHLIPTYAREVYDVSGAGDTVIAVLALALSVGSTVENAAVLGNLAAGVEVGKRGTATVTVEEITAAMDYFHVN